MGGWNYANIGASASHENLQHIKKIFEYMGYSPEADSGENRVFLKPDVCYCMRSINPNIAQQIRRVETLAQYSLFELRYLINALFSGTILYYSSGFGNNTSDTGEYYDNVFVPDNMTCYTFASRTFEGWDKPVECSKSRFTLEAPPIEFVQALIDISTNDQNTKLTSLLQELAQKLQNNEIVYANDDSDTRVPNKEYDVINGDEGISRFQSELWPILQKIRIAAYVAYRTRMEAACREGKSLEEMIENGRKFVEEDEYGDKNAFEQAIQNLDRNASVSFSGKHFVLTGFGLSDAEIIEEIEKRGGVVHKSMVKMADYLVVCLSSPGAAKVKKALEWRQKGASNQIVSDYQVWQAIFAATPAAMTADSLNAKETTSPVEAKKPSATKTKPAASKAEKSKATPAEKSEAKPAPIDVKRVNSENEWIEVFGKYVEKNPQIEFKGKTFAFDSMTNKSDFSLSFNEKIVKQTRNRGGIVRVSISSVTDYLVVRPEWYSLVMIRKAIEQQNSGGKIRIVKEEDFVAAFKRIPTLIQESCSIAEDGTPNLGGETVIPYNAFKGDAKLKAIRIPEGVTNIKKNAFKSCDNLESVVLPKTLLSIEDSAFQDCASLKSITFNDGLETIGDSAFEGCKSLQSITFNEGLKTIGDSAFQYCESLQSITFNDGLETIGDYAFLDCTSLQSITFNEGLETIGEDAFHGCTSLQSVTFNDGLETIGDSAFWGCTSLQSVTFNDGLETIGDGAFQRCESLQSITFNDGLETIGDNAFWGCTSLQSITFNEGLETIGDGAFQRCASLKSITFNEGLETIGEDAFEGCKSLQSITFNEGLKTIGDSAFQYCESLQSVTFNDGLETIGDSAFRYCTSLQSITFNEGLETIGDGAFWGCESLQSITLLISQENALTAWLKEVSYYSNISRATIRIPQSLRGWVMKNDIEEDYGKIQYLSPSEVNTYRAQNKASKSQPRRQPTTSHAAKHAAANSSVGRHTQAYNSKIAFDLPSDYQMIWEDAEDGKKCKIVYGKYKDGDVKPSNGLLENDRDYAFEATVSEVEVNSIDEDIIPAGEKPVDTMNRRQHRSRYIFLSNDHEAELAMLETPVNILGKQLKYYCLYLLVQLSKNKVACIICTSYWNEEEPDSNVEPYRHMLQIINAFRGNGKKLPALQLTAEALMERLEPDFEGKRSLITGKTGIKVKIGDEHEFSSKNYFMGDDDGNVHTKYTFATPSDELYAHYGMLKREADKFTGSGVVYVQNNGEEFQPLDIIEILEKKDRKNTNVYRKLKSAMSADRYDLDQLAVKISQVFRVNKAAFNSRHDDEGDIRECLLDKKWKLSALRSFAWTLADMADREGQSIDDYDYDELVELCSFIEECEWLNYEGESWFNGLCGHPDNHVFYMPGKMVESGEADEICDILSYNPIVSLDAFRNDLMQLKNVMIKLHNGLLQSRNRSVQLDSPAAAVLKAWCVMAMSAKKAFFSEDGPMAYYHSYPTDTLNSKALPVGAKAASVTKATPAPKKANVSTGLESAANYQIVRGADGKERIKMGEYPAGSPITWLVLEKKGQELLLLSEFALDAKPFCAASFDGTSTNEWQGCTLRSWLNEEFYIEAFSAGERSIILYDTHEMYKRTASGEEALSPAMDKVFLLSTREVNQYFPQERDRICKATAYAKERGAEIESGPDQCSWWLRCPVIDAMGMALWSPSIRANGSAQGWGMYSDTVCVRPVIRVKLTETLASKSAAEPNKKSSQTSANSTSKGPKGKKAKNASAAQKPKKRKYAWIGDIIPEGSDQAEIEKELEEMSDEDAQTVIDAMRQLKTLQGQLADLSERVAQEQKEEAERAERAERERREAQARAQREAAERAQREAAERVRREQARREREEAERRAAEARKQEQRNRIKAEIQSLTNEMNSLKGLFAGMKRRKLQKQIDALNEQLRSI